MESLQNASSNAYCEVTEVNPGRSSLINYAATASLTENWSLRSSMALSSTRTTVLSNHMKLPEYVSEGCGSSNW